MKTRLYHKWLLKVIKHIYNGDNEWSWCNKVLENKDVRNVLLLSYALGIWHDHDQWCSGANPHIKKEVDDFKFKYRKYSRKYWTPEARMMRMLKGEND